MKQSLLALSSLRWLQLVTAGCCRSNRCLQAIVAPGLGGQGIEDCSAHVIVTVTATSTVTATVSTTPTKYNTVFSTVVDTVTDTTTASTETQLFTVTSTITASTQTDISQTTQTVDYTETGTQTVTVTTEILQARKRRDGGLDAPAVPSYASGLGRCPSWKKYVSACRCAGVTATTVTVDAEPTTVTEEGAFTTYTADVTSTLLDTTTALVFATATTSTTASEILSITETTAITETSTKTQTATSLTTETTTATQTAACTFVPGAPFKVQSIYQNTNLHLWAQFRDLRGGSLIWQPPSTEPGATVQNRYIFAFDAYGRLYLANPVPSSPYISYPYAATPANVAAAPVLLNTAGFVEGVANTGAASYITGCIHPDTQQIVFNAGQNRREVLRCNPQVWVSEGDGSDIGCTTRTPMIALPV